MMGWQFRQKFTVMELLILEGFLKFLIFLILMPFFLKQNKFKKKGILYYLFK